MLFRLTYYSENHLGAEDGKMIPGLNAIMDVANRNNKRDGITGALLFDSLWFIQILEGGRGAVSATLRRILRDERNDVLTVMDARPIDDRLFANWWMGLGALHGAASESLLAKYKRGGKLDPRLLTAEQVLSLASELAQYGLDRRLATAA
jgi:hypothetical protein